MAQGIIGDIDHQNRLSVLCALTVFETGIQKYVNDQFDIFHKLLQSQMKYLKNQKCSISCSKHKQNLRDCCTLCASWRTTILSKHNQRHNMVKNDTNWSYVDSSQWPEDAREVQKCFNPDWCFKGESCSEDVSVLLTSMYNCQYFKQDVKNIRNIRNIVSHKNKLKVKEKKKYCQMLINFLEDPNIWTYEEAKASSNEIKIFKQKNFLETIENEKNLHLMNLVYKIMELNFSLFQSHEKLLKSYEGSLKSQERWKCSHYFGIVLITIIISFVILVQYEDINKANRTIDYLSGIIQTDRTDRAERVCDLEFGLDFDMNLYGHQQFVGRHWLTEGIHQRMEESRGVLLVADPGYGKSAAMANIIQGKHKLKQINVIHHICISSVATFQRADTFILNIVQNLYCKYPSYGKILEKKGIFMSSRKNEIQTSCKFDPVYCFDELVIEPLSMFVPFEEKRIVLLIDALDECNTIGFGYSVLTLLQLRYNKLPTWIKLLITSKNDSKIIDNFRDLDHWHLYRESDNNKEDMLLYSKKNHLPRDYLKYLKWDFVLVKDMVEKINRNHALSRDNLPKSIDQFFGMEFSYVFESCSSNAFKRATVLYEIIIAGMKPLNKKELLGIAAYYTERKKKNIDFESVFQDMVTTFDQYYLNKDIIKLKPFLQDWMISLSVKHPCKVCKMKGHAAISRFMLSNIDNKKVNVSHDFIVELFMHMQRSEKTKIKIDMLNPLSAYVDNTICGHNLYGVQYEPCHSVLDMFASVVDSFRLMKKMISFSKTTNRTLSAINALLMNNTNSFIAILENSSLDFSCFTNMNRLKTSVNNIYQNNGIDILTDDDVTILHITIIKRNHRAFKLIFEKEKGTLEQKTASGDTTIHLAVMHDNLETFKFLTSNSTIGTVLLRFSAYMRAYTIFNNLLDNGIHDMCVNCMSFQYNQAFKNLEFRMSMFANTEHHTLLTELTCESILNYATRVGDQVIVESILRVSNETVECRDFHGLTPLAGTIVFQHPKLFKFLIERGASVEFRCKPVDVYERTMQMQSIDVYKELYTEITFRPGSEYCPYGRSFGYLSLRWPSCEIMRSLQRKNISSNVLFDIDIHFKTPLYFLICESALHSPFSCKMFLFLLFLFQKPVNQNQIDIIVDSCNSPDIDIHLISYSFSNLISSVICKEPRVHFRTILNFYLKVHIGNMKENTGPFITLLDQKRSKRQIYTGIKLPELFPVKSHSFKEIEMYHKGTSSTKHLNPFFSIGILNKTITERSSV